MPDPVVLASSSATRKTLLENALVPFEAKPARIDERALQEALTAEAATPRDIADQLAEAKARKVSGGVPGRLVLGADQVLEHRSEALGKPESIDEMRLQLQRLRGETHSLWSAAVLCQDGVPVWRHISKASLTMVDFSDAYLEDYLARNAGFVGATVGGYMLEGEGARLFNRVDGDYFTVLGLPLLPLLQQLARMKQIPG